MTELSFDFRLFRYVLASAEHGSFRRAAATLNVQQSTVSRGVRSLEHRVGADLFERSHAGIRPTPAGDRFLQEATLGLDYLRRAMQKLGAVQRAERGELTVAVSVPPILVGDLLERFRRHHEGVSIELVEGTSSAGLALVQQRKADVAFVARARPHTSLRTLHVRSQPMVAILPKTHHLAQACRASFADLSQESFILSEGGMGPDLCEHLVSRMKQLGVQPKLQLHRVGQSTLIDMVTMGFGITISVRALPNGADRALALLPLVGRNVVSLHVGWMESNPNPALKHLLEIVERCAQSERQQ